MSHEANDPTVTWSAAVNPEDLLWKAAREVDRDKARSLVSRCTERLIEETGAGLDLREANLAGCDLSGFDLRRANLNRAVLHGANLSGADLSQASLVCSGLERTSFARAVLRGAYVHALAAQVCNFTDADLEGLVDATGSLFHGCSMAGVRLANSMLAGATFYQCGLVGADLRSANLQAATFNECNLDDLNAEGAVVTEAVFTKSRMSQASLVGASGGALTLQRLTSCTALNLSQANLPDLRCHRLRGERIRAQALRAPQADFNCCLFSGIDLSGADLGASRWVSCHLEEAIFSRARLEEASILHCSIPGGLFEAATAENLHVVESSWLKARMAGFLGRTVTFRDSDLSGADLRHAYLYRAVITGDPPTAMSLRGACLVGAVLVQAYLAADLHGADLEGASLAYARLNQSVLSAANLGGVSAFEASLVKTDLREARINGLKPPVFADRCPGLTEALEKGDTGDLAPFLTELRRLLTSVKGGST